ncbi:hypothetical protein [Flavobacterium nitratireducens]|uniref:hypothetical protein n=1 Tax=Flavobacterium nitratireducens TaxID=992289 RepID=UPI002415958B|nr:hypothetical protein [Flavobacterium nitratireducens]
MKSVFYKVACLALGMLLFSCSDEDSVEGTQIVNKSISNSLEMARSGNSKTPTNTSKRWDFNDLNEWDDATQAGNPNYWIDNGVLHIFTNANTWDRTKVKSVSTYAAGTYSWRVYVPEMGVGDCASIGAFLYSDDTHELDFEIGYGNTAIRQQLNAVADDLIVYATSQANPSHSFQTKIKRGQWYTFSIHLTLNNKKKYVVNWKIDDTVITSTTLNYGSSTKFKIFCSVENLNFIGDHIPTIQNYALFDWVTFN